MPTKDELEKENQRLREELERRDADDQASADDHEREHHGAAIYDAQGFLVKESVDEKDREEPA